MADEDALRRMMSRFEEQAARASALRDEISALQGSARNADGSVTVTVAPSGAVLGLNLSPAAMNKTYTQLTQEILSTIRAATERAAQAMEDTVKPALGEEYYQRFQDALRAHSPQGVEIGPTAPPDSSTLPPPGQPQLSPEQARNQTQSPPVRRPAADEDDFDGDSIFGGGR